MTCQDCTTATEKRLHVVSVDWFRLIWDIVQRGHNLTMIERSTGISGGTLRGYIAGSHPPHWRGERLIDLWCDICAKSRFEAPTADVVLTPRVVIPQAQVQDRGALIELERAWRARA